MTLLEALKQFATALVNRNNEADIDAAVQALHDTLNPPAQPASTEPPQ